MSVSVSVWGGPGGGGEVQQVKSKDIFVGGRSSGGEEGAPRPVAP